MKKTLSVLMTVLLILSMGLISCSKKEAPAAAAPAAEVKAEPLKVVLILNGVLGDKSFFDSADNGMKMIAKKYGDKVSVKTIEMSYDQTKWEPTLQDVSEEDWDIVICGTWQMVEMLQDIAPEYPDKRYIIFDSGVDYSLGNLDNVYSIGYKQNEASFIAGVLAARMTTSGQPLANDAKMVGFLGGMDIPVINDFLIGYIEGAQYVDTATKVAISYIGSFSDSAKGKEMALAQYNLGVDIGYNVAGQAGLGQLDAAKDVNRYAIGVDSDQAAIFAESDAAKAELITTSVLKRVDNSLLRAIDLHMEGKLPYGEMEVLGFSEDCVGLAENDIYTRVVPADIRSELADVEKKIVSGEIVVGSAFGMTTEELNSLRNAVKP